MAITGTTCWGHSTGVTQTNTRTFNTNWTGTGAISGSGDSEKISLDSGEYMESEIVNTGSVTVTVATNNYTAGDTVTVSYRTAATEGGVSGASYSTYSAPFASSGYVQVKVSSSASPTYLFSETFDGATACGDGASTCDHTWADVSRIDMDSTSPALQGSHSLQITSTSGEAYAHISFTGQSAITYATFIIQITSGTDAFWGMIVSSSGGTNMGGIQFIWSTDHWYPKCWYSTNSYGDNGSASIANGEKWYCKIEYTAGTGANAKWSFYAVKDNAGFPGWGTGGTGDGLQYTYSTADDTANFEQIKILRDSGTTVVNIDDIRVDNENITY